MELVMAELGEAMLGLLAGSAAIVMLWEVLQVVSGF